MAMLWGRTISVLIEIITALTKHSYADGTISAPLCITTYRAKKGRLYTHTHTHTCLDLKQTLQGYLVSFSHSRCIYMQEPHLDSRLSTLTRMLLIQTQLLSVLACTFPHMHKCSCRYLPGDSLHLCQHSILPAFTSSVTYTLGSMQTSFESI